MTNKNSLRQNLRAKRKQLSPETRAKNSTYICQSLAELPQMKSTTNIGVYAAVGSEVELSKFIEWAWQHDKNLFLPSIIDAENKQMEFFAFNEDTLMRTNEYAIEEPDPSGESAIDPSELELIVLPLVGFDKNNYRLGQGGGFYDCFLSQYQDTNERPYLVGVAFSCQYVDALPIDAWDRQLDCVLSDE